MFFNFFGLVALCLLPALNALSMESPSRSIDAAEEMIEFRKLRDEIKDIFNAHHRFLKHLSDQLNSTDNEGEYQDLVKDIIIPNNNRRRATQTRENFTQLKKRINAQVKEEIADREKFRDFYLMMIDNAVPKLLNFQEFEPAELKKMAHIGLFLITFEHYENKKEAIEKATDRSPFAQSYEMFKILEDVTEVILNHTDHDVRNILDKFQSRAKNKRKEFIVRQAQFYREQIAKSLLLLHQNTSAAFEYGRSFIPTLMTQRDRALDLEVATIAANKDENQLMELYALADAVTLDKSLQQENADITAYLEQQRQLIPPHKEKEVQRGAPIKAPAIADAAVPTKEAAVADDNKTPASEETTLQQRLGNNALDHDLAPAAHEKGEPFAPKKREPPRKGRRKRAQESEKHVDTARSIHSKAMRETKAREVQISQNQSSMRAQEIFSELPPRLRGLLDEMLSERNLHKQYEFRDLVSIVAGLGGQRVGDNGSHFTFKLAGIGAIHLVRPHGGKDTVKLSGGYVRAFLAQLRDLKFIS